MKLQQSFITIHFGMLQKNLQKGQTKPKWVFAKPVQVYEHHYDSFQVYCFISTEYMQ